MFSKITAEENVVKIDINFQHEILENGLRFIIYYNNPKFILRPLLDQEIINGRYDYQIVVSSDILLNDIDKLNLLTSTDYERCEMEFMKYAVVEKRILCEFRNRNNNLLLSYSHGNGDYIMLNDFVIKKNKVLYELIEYFLPRNIIFFGKK
jgi:hypothetical protein